MPLRSLPPFSLLAPAVSSSVPAASAPGDSDTVLRPPATLARTLELMTSHLVVALVALVGIGGATRVMEAGLACPDWPLCYGVLLPSRQMNLQVFLEWFHRLDAFLVGMALLVLSALSLRFRAWLPHWLPWASGGALALVAVQGGLGALTVLRLLESSTVTAHLATALLLVLLLSAVHQKLSVALAQCDAGSVQPLPPLPLWWSGLALVAGGLVLAQCVLGGAMASQWAADRCFSVGDGCRWLLAHRLGAYPAALTVFGLALGSLALPRQRRGLRGFAAAAAVLVLAQVFLGVLALRLKLAVPAVTVSHQLVASLLVAVIGAIGGRTLSGSARPTGAIQSPTSPSPLEVAHG
jgi:cytochrome c oxidase assembly protein subunit 15